MVAMGDSGGEQAYMLFTKGDSRSEQQRVLLVLDLALTSANPHRLQHLDEASCTNV